MSPRVWRIGGLAGAALLLAVAWLLLINPILNNAAALQDQVVSQEQASDQLRSRISLLKKQSEEMPEQEAILAQIQQRMPPSTALPSLIRDLTTVSENANVIVASVTPGLPTPVEPPVEVVAPAPTADDATADDAAAADDAPAVAVATGPQVESMSLSITACGTFAQLRNYLRQLESMKRVVAVSALSVARGSCAEGSPEDDLTATIGANAFTLPNAAPPVADTADAPKANPKAKPKAKAKSAKNGGGDE